VYRATVYIHFLVVSDFVPACPRHLTVDVFSKLLTSVLSGAKSSNAAVRVQSCRLFSVLMGRKGNEGSLVSLAVTEILALPKANKTTGVDHRIALYEMLQFVTPTDDVASLITSSLPSLIAKETNDTAVSLLAKVLALHITYRLRRNQNLEPDVINGILREMSSSKPGLRRSFCAVAGNALWCLGDDRSGAAQAFATSLYPAFDASLKTISANPLNSTVGPLEGYMVLATLLGPVSRLGVHDYGDSRSPDVLFNAISHMIK
jgi:Generalcontrol nonderepressible 1 (Gcn1) N-terminal